MTGHRVIVAALAVAAAATTLVAPLAMGGDEWKRTRDAGEMMLDQSVELTSSGVLDVDVSDVNIELKQTSGSTGDIKVYVSGRDVEEAREYFEDLHFEVRGENNTMRVDTRRSRWIDRSWTWRNRVRVWAVITVPEGTEIKIATDDGNIVADELSSKARLRTSDGDIEIGTAAGAELIIRTSDGDVRCGRLESPRVEVVTSDGNIVVEDASGDFVSFGTSDGNVVVTKATAKEMHLRTSDGDIRVDLSAEELKAKTSDGDIRLKMRGGMKANLHTTDGDIFVEAPSDLKANLDLRADRVRVGGDVEVRGTISNNRVVGTLKGGGPDITARTSDGKISFSLR